MRTFIFLIISISFCCLNGLAQPYFFQIDVGTGKHFDKVSANQDFYNYGMEVKQPPLARLNTQLGYRIKNHQFSLGLGYFFLRSQFQFGPIYTQPYAKEYIKELVYSQRMLSGVLLYQYQLYDGNYGKVKATGAILYSDKLNTFWDTEFPYRTHISGSRLGPVIESRTSTLYYRNADVGAELGMMYYPPLKTRRLRYYVRASYTHYFRPWGGYESDYYRIYDLNDPDVLLAEVEYSGTTYNRHVSLTIGFERQFGKKRYSRDQPF